MLEDHRLPQVSFQLLIPGAGGYDDPADQPGLASFTAALMREGTATRTSEQIAQQLEIMAATLNVRRRQPAGSDDHRLVPQRPGRQADRPRRRHPPPPVVPGRGDRGVQAAHARAADPAARESGFSRGGDVLAAVYGSHPAARISPTLAAVDAAEARGPVGVPPHALPARSRRPRRRRRCVDAAGADARRIKARRLDEVRRGDADRCPSRRRLKAAKIYFIARPSSVQTNLIVGTPAIERTSPDYDVLSVMNKIVGGGPTGRLFLHLREEKGYTYGASSALDAPQHRGDWSASTNVRTEVTEPALRDLLEEIAQIREIPVTDQELADAKRSMVASFALSLESPAQLLNSP